MSDSVQPAAIPTPFNMLARRLDRALGKGLALAPSLTRSDPQVFEFCQRQVLPRFTGLADTALVALHVPSDKPGFMRHLRIERLDTHVVATLYQQASSGVHDIHGAALETSPASRDEDAFIQLFLSRFLFQACQPLASVLAQLRQDGLALEPVIEMGLRRRLFPNSPERQAGDLLPPVRRC